MTGHYAELYRKAREALESDAEAQLQRPLTTHERNLFRSCGTLTMLENLGMNVYCADSPEDLARKLAETTMQPRFVLALQEMAERLQRLLGRPLTKAERQQLHTFGNTEELWHLEEQVTATLPDERETSFHKLLFNTQPELTPQT